MLLLQDWCAAPQLETLPRVTTWDFKFVRCWQSLAAMLDKGGLLTPSPAALQAVQQCQPLVVHVGLHSVRSNDGCLMTRFYDQRVSHFQVVQTLQQSARLRFVILSACVCCAAATLSAHTYTSSRAPT